MKKILIDCIKAALEAGKITEEVYHSAFEVDIKSDNTPVTIADKLSSKKIIETLMPHHIPIISEEEIGYSNDDMQHINTFFVIDPLDGTREFIKKNGEFTINIALIENREPVLGVVYAPILKLLYFGAKHLGAYKVPAYRMGKLLLYQDLFLDDLLKLSEKLPLFKLPDVYTIITSRSHLDEKTSAYIDKKREEYPSLECIRMGSSIKLCLLAEGKAHEYPRFGRTMEWDIAAAHIILREAGGDIIEAKQMQRLMYHKNNFENPDFIAYAMY